MSQQTGSLTAIGNELVSGTELNNVAYTESRLTDAVTTGLVLANGTANIEGEKVIFTPSNLEMSNENIFYYEYKTVEGEYFYSTVTVIPATNIYYEDSFFTFKDGDGYTWKTAGETLADKYQSEDRPGSFESADADNVYGEDSAYNNTYTYSLGSSRYTSVDEKSVGKEPTAEFTFCGTGFDLFSVTNNDTGAVLVSVYKTNGKLYKNYIVSTYYGYSYEEDTFKPNPDSKDSLYCVPVISARELGYDTYRVVIKPLYSRVFDPNFSQSENADNSYDIYVDSVRIYNPAGLNPDKETVIGNAYIRDGEYSPEYLEMRRNILSAEDFYDKELEGTEFGKGSIFIDSIGSLDGTGISNKYLEAGPNNELYLAKGQAVAFHIVSDVPLALSSVQLGMKVVRPADDAEDNSEKSANVVIMNTNDYVYNNIEVSSSHAMYRRLNSAIIWDEEIISTTGVYQTKYPIVVANTSDSIISLTEIKWAYSEEPEPIATGLQLAVTSGTPEQALLATQAALEKAETPPFDAEEVKVEWNNTDFKEGAQATLVITTPAEVEKVTVDGIEVKAFDVNADGTKTWNYGFEIKEAGEKSYEILLYDGENKLLGEPVKTASIEIEEKSFFEKLLDAIIDFFKKIINFVWCFVNERIY